jgi:hypothetical protein
MVNISTAIRGHYGNDGYLWAIIIRRFCDSEDPHQLLLCADDEIQALEAHVRLEDPADAVTGHPKPGDDVETRKGPYLVHQLSVFEIDTNE